MLIGGFPRHIVTVHINGVGEEFLSKADYLHFGTFDSLRSCSFSLLQKTQVVKTEKTLSQLVEQFGSDEAKAKLAQVDPELTHLCLASSYRVTRLQPLRLS